MRKSLILVISVFVTLISAPQLNSQDLGIRADFPFSGSADDISGNGNNGIVEGPILTTDRNGEPNSAYEFDGVDDRIVVIDNQSLWLEGDYTIDVWFMPSSVKTGTILRKNSSQNSSGTFPAYGAGLSGTQHFVFNVNTDMGPNGISTQIFALNLQYKVDTWYRMIARRSGDMILMTINEFGTSFFATFDITLEGETNYDSSPLLIGTRSSQVANTFHGKIDDIRIFDRFLTLEEVTGKDFNDDGETTSVRNLNLVDMEVYPNPTTDVVNVVLPEVFNADKSYLKIYNSDGIEFRNQKIQIGNNPISISELTSGTYFIEVTDGDSKAVNQIFKQ